MAEMTITESVHKSEWAPTTGEVKDFSHRHLEADEEFLFWLETEAERLAGYAAWLDGVRGRAAEMRGLVPDGFDYVRTDVEVNASGTRADIVVTAKESE